MEKPNIYIGEIIKNVMAEKQVTKAELARRLQVKPQSVDYMLTRKALIQILSITYQRLWIMILLCYILLVRNR